MALGTAVAAGTLVSFWQIAVPSYWYDEAATLSGATRPLSSLFAMADSVDAVHTAYYVLMHAWYRLGDGSELWMRAPSAIAVVVASVGMYLLGRLLSGRTVGALAAGLFFVLPRTTWAATEARSFAIATALLVFAVLAATAATMHRRRWALVLFVPLAAASVAIFVYTALVIGAVVASLCILVRRDRGRWLPLAACTAAVALLNIPFVLEVSGQRAQLGGIRQLGPETLTDVFVAEFFPDAWWAASIFWMALIVAVALASPAMRGLWRNQLAAVTIPWLTLPHVVIIGYSLIAGSIYQPRAMIITAPALCLLVAAVLRRGLGNRLAALAVILIAALAAPAYFAAREQTAKNTDWRDVAETIAEESVDTGAAMVFIEPESSVHEYSSLVTLAYPHVLAGISDPALAARSDTIPQLWDVRLPSDDLCAQLAGARRVLLVHTATISEHRVSEVHSALQDDGLVAHEQIRTPLTVIDVLERRSDAVC